LKGLRQNLKNLHRQNIN